MFEGINFRLLDQGLVEGATEALRRAYDQVPPITTALIQMGKECHGDTKTFEFNCKVIEKRIKRELTEKGLGTEIVNNWRTSKSIVKRAVELDVDLTNAFTIRDVKKAVDRGE